MAQANNTYRETTTTSWFSRLKQALTGIVIGLILVAASLVLLFWNEGRAIKTYRALTEGAGSIVSVGPEEPATFGLGTEPAYLTSGCVARKMGPAIVSWEAEAGDLYDLAYTHGTEPVASTEAVD